MRVDGHDLGLAMLPNDLLIALRATAGLTAALRAVSLTRAWWTALADTLDACGPTTPAGRPRAQPSAAGGLKRQRPRGAIPGASCKESLRVLRLRLRRVRRRQASAAATGRHSLRHRPC